MPPQYWGQEEVRDWILQYMELYGSHQVKMSDFDMRGSELCKLSKEMFFHKVGKEIGGKMLEDLTKRNGGSIF